LTHEEFSKKQKRKKKYSPRNHRILLWVGGQWTIIAMKDYCF
jgi:hypothetical protein